ncbi:MAG: cysteine desulfurase [Magnetococcales bacterium]|nr:cysteine desulfurase [Magnetococcales bacterium]
MIYLDHNATSPPRPGVADAVRAALAGTMGNPASVHGPGRAARQKLDEARRQVAGLMDVHESRIVFTSGGTESNHLALFGMAMANDLRGTIVVSGVEHPSVLLTCTRLAELGMTIHTLPVDGTGRVDPQTVRDAIDTRTLLVSVMAANNETGVLQPIREIGAICREKEIPLHVDATQWAGKLPMDEEQLPADLLTLSGHKFGGPKGAGALIVASGISLIAQLTGGGQERGRRSGTENLPGIAGFGVAASEVSKQLPTETTAITRLREHLEHRLLEVIPDARIFGQEAPRLPNTTAVGIRGVDGETLVMALDLAGCAISSGSACASGKTTPSHVLLAMGEESAYIQGAVRVSLGWNTDIHAVDSFITAIKRSVDRLRQGSMLS